jgi:hypothetical protein
MRCPILVIFARQHPLDSDIPGSASADGLRANRQLRPQYRSRTLLRSLFAHVVPVGGVCREFADMNEPGRMRALVVSSNDSLQMKEAVTCLAASSWFSRKSESDACRHLKCRYSHIAYDL